MSMTSDDFSFGTLLQMFRRRQHLTQQILADSLGMHRRTLIRWEQGDYLPESRTMVLELARHLHLNDQETRQLLEGSLTALVPHWLVPLPHNPYFTGREEILKDLHRQLKIEQTVALTQSSALHGLGGVGKTQIALEYAYRHVLEYSAVLWIGAETEEQIVSSLLGIADVLQLPERDDKDQQRVVTAVQRWLSTHDRWLLIWDNVEDLDILQRFLPAVRSGAILITTRCQALGTLARGLDLLPMEHEEGLLFLLRRAKVLSPEATIEQVRYLATQAPLQYAAASELVTILGGLPLALDQAGAYLEETHCGLLAYLDLFRTRRDALLQRRGARIQDHPTSVYTTFTLAITAVIECHPAVRDLLQICALLQSDAIPEEIFRQGGEHLSPTLEIVGSNPLEWDRVVGMACAYSLLARQPEAQTLSLHRLVQAVLLDTMEKTEQEMWRRRVIEALNNILPEVEYVTEYSAWKQCERLLPHIHLCLRRVEVTWTSLPLASLSYKTACYLFRYRRYKEAEPFLQRALYIQEQELGSGHLLVAASLNKLAILFLNQGEYVKAVPFFQRSLHIREQVLGSEHPEVAASLNNLAVLYWEQGEYVKAERHFRRALHIREQAHGPEHPLVAASLNNLAEISLAQGKYTEVEPILRRALQIWGQALGPEHPGVVDPLCLLADLFREQGKYIEADSFYQRALHIAEQVLGPRHPNVAALLYSQADCYRIQKKYAEAEPLYQKAVHILEQRFGPEYPEMAYSLTGQANLNRDRGKYVEAQQLYQRALSLREKQLDQYHPKIAQILYDFAIFQQKQGNLSEALSLAERTLSIRAKMLGEAHPKTIATRTLYAQLVRELMAGAEPTLEHLRTLLKARGWSVHLKKRRDKPYVYATRKAGQHTHSRYLAPLSNLVACLAAASTLPNAKEE